MSEQGNGSDGVQAVIERMSEAATALLTALTPQQRPQATYGFPEEEERRRWYYTPTQQGGLPLGAMTPGQQRLAHRLVASGLSMPGYVTAATIMGLENTLDMVEGWRSFPGYPGRPGHDRGRDPGMYFVSIFGTPGGSAPWGWRFGGHHISLHYTLADGRVVSPTPTFFGSDPAEAPFAGAGALRPLGGVEDAARELLHALDDAQRAAAIISAVAPIDIVQTNRASVEDDAVPRGLWEIFGPTLTDAERERFRQGNAAYLRAVGFTSEHEEAIRHTRAPKGLPAARMTATQRQMLTALIRQYIVRMPDAIAELETAKLVGDALDAVHFAWAGGLQRREPHYYRLHGPRFLVEYDNVQRDTNHIHSVWRDPEGDFGADILAQHYATAHA